MSFWWIAPIAVIVIVLLAHAFRRSVKHSAVQNAFLAKYTFDRLTDQQRGKVKEQTLGIMRRGGMLEDDFDGMSEMLKFSFLALALAELGIPPALPKEEWHYVKNPYMALHNSEHAIKVIRHHLEHTHNIRLDLEWHDHLISPTA
jgi:hypothetical protein